MPHLGGYFSSSFLSSHKWRIHICCRTSNSEADLEIEDNTGHVLIPTILIVFVGFAFFDPGSDMRIMAWGFIISAFAYLNFYEG